MILACFSDPALEAAKEISDIKKRVAALPDTEQISGPSEFEILLGYLKTVTSGSHNLNTFTRILTQLIWSDQQTE